MRVGWSSACQQGRETLSLPNAGLAGQRVREMPGVVRASHIPSSHMGSFKFSFSDAGPNTAKTLPSSPRRNTFLPFACVSKISCA